MMFVSEGWESRQKTRGVLFGGDQKWEGGGKGHFLLLFFDYQDIILAFLRNSFD